MIAAAAMVTWTLKPATPTTAIHSVVSVRIEPHLRWWGKGPGEGTLSRWPLSFDAGPLVFTTVLECTAVYIPHPGESVPPRERVPGGLGASLRARTGRGGRLTRGPAVRRGSGRLGGRRGRRGRSARQVPRVRRGVPDRLGRRR